MQEDGKHKIIKLSQLTGNKEEINGKFIQFFSELIIINLYW